MTRDEWMRVERDLQKPEVQNAMRGRCEEQGHDWDYGVTSLFQMSRFCKWCGERK